MHLSAKGMGLILSIGLGVWKEKIKDFIIISSATPLVKLTILDF